MYGISIQKVQGRSLRRSNQRTFVKIDRLDDRNFDKRKGMRKRCIRGRGAVRLKKKEYQTVFTLIDKKKEGKENKTKQKKNTKIFVETRTTSRRKLIDSIDGTSLMVTRWYLSTRDRYRFTPTSDRFLFFQARPEEIDKTKCARYPNEKSMIRFAQNVKRSLIESFNI